MAIVFSEPAAGVPPRRPVAAAALCAATGFLVWAVLSFASGHTVDDRFVVREAWDSGPYWVAGLPLVALIAAVAGFMVPRRVWRWPAWAALGQALAMALVHPPGTEPGLVPVAALFIGIPLVLLMTVPALIAGVAARRGWSLDLLR